MNNLTKYKRFIVYFILFIFLIIGIFTIKTPKNGSITSNISPALLELKEGDVIEKVIKQKIEETQFFAIKFATFMDNNIKGKLNVIIIKDSDEIYNEIIDTKDIKDNNYLVFKFDKTSSSDDYKIIINVLELDKNKKLAIYGHYSNDDFIKINNKKSDIDFEISYGYKGNSKRLLIYIPILFVLICFIELLRKDEEKNEKNTKKHK